MKRPARTNPTIIKRAERVYTQQLSRLARHVGEIVSQFEPTIETVPTLENMLRQYAVALAPWAKITAMKMLSEIDHRDRAAWQSNSLQISEALRREILNAPVGERMRQLLDDQVGLITSLPIEAAKRVHELTLKGLENSERAAEVEREIMRTGEVTASRARLIARTETSRTATALVQARAEHVGSEFYIWRSSGDGDVRPDHKRLNGKAFRWDSPPVADEKSGARAHPGMIYNCRCYAEPVLPD